jgi:hypothetical protein
MNNPEKNTGGLSARSLVSAGQNISVENNSHSRSRYPGRNTAERLVEGGFHFGFGRSLRLFVNPVEMFLQPAPSLPASFFP